jgi:hypothetical protein
VAVAAGWRASPPVLPHHVIDWKGFEAYLLQRRNKMTTGDKLRYAKQYASVLSSGLPEDLLQLTGEKRLHVMKTLSSLSKFTGQYDKWLQLRQHYNLKWANENANLQSFERFINEGLNYDIMLQGIKEMISKTPRSHGPNYQIRHTYRASPQ